MSDQGIIANVTITTLGDELAADVAAAASSLTVADPFDFSETGGYLTLGLEVLPYSSVDSETGVVTLAAPTVGAYATGERVDCYPLGQEKWADVVLSGDNEAVSALVPLALWDRIPEGARGGTGESVEIVGDLGDLEVSNVLGAVPSIDASFLDETTTVPPAALTDGVAPSASPTPTVEPLGIMTLRARWTPLANPDPLTYDVYASTVSPVVADAAHFVGTSTGSTLSFARIDGVDLTLVVHYVAVVARDADGAAPTSAEGSGTPRQASDPDVSATYVYAGRVEAGQIDAGIIGSDISVAGSFTVAEYDEFGTIVPGTKRAEISSAGIFAYKRDPLDSAAVVETMALVDGNAKFKGDVEADHLTVYDGSIQGGTNEIAEAAILNLSSGVTTPTNPPSLQATYTQVQFTGGHWAVKHGAAFDGTHWYTTRMSGASAVLEKWTAAGALTANASVYPANNVGGVVWNGTDLYALIDAEDGWQVYRFDEATLALVGSPSNWIHADGTRTPAIGWATADAEIRIAQSKTSDDKVQVRRYTFNAGGNLTVGGSTVTCTTTYPRDLAGIILISTTEAAAAGFAASRYVYMGYGVGTEFQVMNTSGVIQSLEVWPYNAAGDGGGICGFHWDGTNFKSIDHAGLLRTYEAGAGNRWTTATDATWDVAYTWYRATGTLETVRSPTAVFTMTKRAKLVVTTASLPVGGATPPSAARVYLKKGTTRAGTTLGNMSRQAATTAGSPPTLTVVNADFAGTADPTTSSFGTTGTPAKLQSQTGGFVVNGDGTGLWPLAGIRPDVRCLIRRTSFQTLTTSVYTVIAFDVEDSDPSGMNASGVITVPVAGIYHLVANVAFNSHATGRRFLALNKNSATVPPPTPWIGHVEVATNLTAGMTVVSFAWEDRLAASDVLRLWAFQSSGGNLNIPADSGMPSLSLRWVAP